MYGLHPVPPLVSMRDRRAGILFCLVAAGGFSTIGILAVDRLGRQTPPLALSAVTSTGAATIFLLTGLVLRNLQVDVSPQGWGGIIGIAFATALPLAAFYRGIAAVGPSTGASCSPLNRH